ncbi:MAG: flagellar hook-basal body protein [Oscillospiraceae bacterium]|nr:flagellar hook-basal body protein [Oscillospiraceae bacterium]
MIQTMYNGLHGMLSHQQNLDNIANNIANINSHGYKRSRTEFKETLYARMLSPTDNAPQVNLQRGAGVIPSQTLHNFEQGALLDTERALDFALEGPGFFAVATPAGERLYTRDGAFYLTPEADGEYLVDKRGYYLLDTDGARIHVSGDASTLSADARGGLSLRAEAGDSTPFARLALVEFDNPGGLLATGDGCYRPSENTGALREAAGATLRQGALEASNVDYAEEMARLIRAQRAYQLSSRCVTTADQMSQICNSIRS